RDRVHFFDKRQRNEPKKTLFIQGKSGKSSSRGFFYGTSMSHRKTPHILLRRSPGLQASGSHRDLQKQVNSDCRRSAAITPYSGSPPRFRSPTRTTPPACRHPHVHRPANDAAVRPAAG